MMGRWIAICPLVMMAACQPPAAEDYLERGTVEEALPQASEPLPSPDTSDAVWAPSDTPERLLYGVPGETPLLAVQCDRAGETPRIAFTRFVRADREAQAMMAVVGNFHALRLPVDSTSNGRAWLWQGTVDASDPDLEALTGQRPFEATIPGAGTVKLKPSQLVRDLLNVCRVIPEEDPQVRVDAEPDLPAQ